MLVFKWHTWKSCLHHFAKCIILVIILKKSQVPNANRQESRSGQDDSNKWSNIGFGEEIKQLESNEINFTCFIRSYVECKKVEPVTYTYWLLRRWAATSPCAKNFNGVVKLVLTARKTWRLKTSLCGLYHSACCYQQNDIKKNLLVWSQGKPVAKCNLSKVFIRGFIV